MIRIDIKHCDLIDKSAQQPEFNTINRCDVTLFDSEDDCCTGCHNVSQWFPTTTILSYSIYLVHVKYLKNC